MQARMTPQNFVEKWTGVDLTEKQTYQQHFLDVCDLFGFDKPMGKTRKGDEFIFERYTKEEDGQQGYADVFLENHFAIEYKAPNRYKSLDEAYQQLQRYRERLKNPPLLVVTDINNWEIHTNFFNTEKKIYRFTNEQIIDSANHRILRLIFENPNELHPDRSAEDVTKEAAASFKDIVDNMREANATPEQIAHFLTKLTFCLFAEDVGLLPVMDSGKGLFTHIVSHTRDDDDAERFKQYVHNLFDAMNEGKELMMQPVEYFNGSLFADVAVVGLGRTARNKLFDASLLNWAYVEPTIFGTLFERAIDEKKRSQLGAHYTSRDDIMLIVEPVLLKPLQRQWATIRQQADSTREKYDAAQTGKARADFVKELITLRDTMLKALQDVTVLDPACGSGNFLYVALQALLEFEQEVMTYEAWSRVTEIRLPEPKVHPKQMYGIEINPIAHALASIVVWIGYIQWKMNNGYPIFEKPILQDIHDNIVQKDAILAYKNTSVGTGPALSAENQDPSALKSPSDASGGDLEGGSPTEPDWPTVDVIIGNPPLFGGKEDARRIRGYICC